MMIAVLVFYFLRAQAADTYLLETMRTKCLAENPCRVEASGSLGQFGTGAYYYALYGSQKSDKPFVDGCEKDVIAAAVFYQPTGSNQWSISKKVLRTEGGCIQKPVVSSWKKEVILKFPVTLNQATQADDFSEYYLLKNGQATSLDTESWVKEFYKRVGKLQCRTGLQWDIESMSVSTPLWRPSDSNADATGGNADIDLGIKDSKVVIIDLRLNPYSRSKK